MHSRLTLLLFLLASLSAFASSAAKCAGAEENSSASSQQAAALPDAPAAQRDSEPPSDVAPAPTAAALPQASTPKRGFFARWLANVAKTQSEQPHWITPVVTVTPRLEQEFRYDMSRQVQPNGDTVLDNFGGAKGLEIIPSERIELLLNPPPFTTRNPSGLSDGYGDASFLMKYRVLSANEESGNYILTAFFGGTIPTGSHTNGLPDATISPTLMAGKGWGNFDFSTTFGAILPVSETNLIGRQIVWNTAFQYRLLRKIWPEFEVNSNFFSDGPFSGKKQTFLTPGIVLGKFPIWHRLGFTVGTGVQIAATQFHQYNHKYILTVRFPF